MSLHVALIFLGVRVSPQMHKVDNENYYLISAHAAFISHSLTGTNVAIL